MQVILCILKRNMKRKSYNITTSTLCTTRRVMSCIITLFFFFSIHHCLIFKCITYTREIPPFHKRFYSHLLTCILREDHHRRCRQDLVVYLQFIPFLYSIIFHFLFILQHRGPTFIRLPTGIPVFLFLCRIYSI